MSLFYELRLIEESWGDIRGSSIPHVSGTSILTQLDLHQIWCFAIRRPYLKNCYTITSCVYHCYKPGLNVRNNWKESPILLQTHKHKIQQGFWKCHEIHKKMLRNWGSRWLKAPPVGCPAALPQKIWGVCVCEGLYFCHLQVIKVTVIDVNHTLAAVHTAPLC